MTTPQNTKTLTVENLRKVYPIRGSMFSNETELVHAVSGVDFDISPGETLGLVGESGCGKTTVGQCVLRIVEPTSGKLMFKGRDIGALKKEDLRALRHKVQMIFQDPYGSLNPKWSVGRIVGEGLDAHGVARGTARETLIDAILDKVGLRAEDKHRRPHEFSGGQRQRISIARALILEPALIVADEPLSALDVSIQAQVINLLINLQREFGFAFLLISHDLSVVRYISDRIAVMYLGKIVEILRADELHKASHPYTRALLSAIPVPAPSAKRERIILTGDIPSPINLPKGCRFAPRCPSKIDICDQMEPALINIGPEQLCSCHLFDGLHKAVR